MDFKDAFKVKYNARGQLTIPADIRNYFNLPIEGTVSLSVLNDKGQLLIDLNSEKEELADILDEMGEAIKRDLRLIPSEYREEAAKLLEKRIQEVTDEVAENAKVAYEEYKRGETYSLEDLKKMWGK